MLAGMLASQFLITMPLFRLLAGSGQCVQPNDSPTSSRALSPLVLHHVILTSQALTSQVKELEEAREDLRRELERTVLEKASIQDAYDAVYDEAQVCGAQGSSGVHPCQGHQQAGSPCQ
jgi:hypothetical protein